MKKTKTIAIILLVAITIGLTIFITLLLTGTINLNVKNSNDNTFNITYKEEEYIKSTTDGIEIRNLRNIPSISSSDRKKVASKITKYLTDISNKEWDNIKKTTDDVVESNVKEEDMGITLLYKESIVTSGRLSFTLEMVGNFGGVTWNNESAYNFDAKTGKILTLKGIGKDTYDIIKKECEDYIEMTEEINAQSFYEKEERQSLDDLLSKEETWYFEYNQLVVVFPKYSISNQEVKIPIAKSKINDSLYDQYKF